MAIRPAFLVAEPEPQQALSVRKLVLETGKFNVITAHSTREAVETFHLFPNVAAAILAGESEIDCDKVASTIKGATDKVPIIHLHASIGGRCVQADHHLSSHEPEALLDLVRSLFGDPREIESAPKQPSLSLSQV